MRSRLCVLVLVASALAGCGGGRSAQPSRVAGEVVTAPEPVVAAPEPVVAAPAPPRKAPLPLGCSADARACVSVTRRLAWLQENGRVVHGPVPVALGMPGHRTPKGHFRVAWKDEEHTSSIYGIDMPYSVFFAPGGIAFHQGPLDEPSHGCVHLAPEAAAAFFAALERGDRVHVF